MNTGTDAKLHMAMALDVTDRPTETVQIRIFTFFAVSWTADRFPQQCFLGVLTVKSGNLEMCNLGNEFLNLLKKGVFIFKWFANGVMLYSVSRYLPEPTQRTLRAKNRFCLNITVLYAFKNIIYAHLNSTPQHFFFYLTDIFFI